MFIDVSLKQLATRDQKLKQLKKYMPHTKNKLKTTTSIIKTKNIPVFN
jgi:hypothetical protein